MNRITLGTSLLSILAAGAALASAPLDPWQWRNPLPNGNGLSAVTYADGLFVAVGSGGQLDISADGTNWTSRFLGPIFGAGTNYGFSAIARGNGTWVAVGSAQRTGGAGSFGLLLTSPDLVNWTPAFIPENVTSLGGVVYAQGLFVAVGSAYNVDTYEQSAAILTSGDGVHWAPQDYSISYPFFSRIIYGNGEFMAAISGIQGVMLTSPDGTNWTATASDRFSGLAYRNGLYLACHGLGIVASTDGRVWTNQVSSFGAEAIAFGNGLFVAAGSGGKLQTSPDGLHWTRRNAVTTETISDLAYGAGTFVGVGIMRLASSNGVGWTNLGSNVTTKMLNDVAYGQGAFVAVGSGSSVLRSTNGLQWTLSAWGLTGTSFNGVASGAGKFVVAASSGRVLVSTNSIDWVVATNTGSTHSLQDVAYGDERFVIVGRRDDSTVQQGGAVLVSTNGTEWADVSPPSAPALYAVGYGHGLFFAFGLDAVLTSTNGYDWSQPDFSSRLVNAVEALTYGRGQFVAVGWGGLILHSTNGVDWTTAQSGTVADLYSATYARGRFLVTGRSGTILSSTNGTDWVSHDSGTMNSLLATAFGGDTFVTVGIGGTILQSGVLPSPSLRLSPVPGWVNGGGSFGLTLLPPPDEPWEIQASTNLLHWTALGTVPGTNSPELFLDSEAAQFQRRYYRAVNADEPR